MQSVELKPDLCNPQLLVVIMVVLTEIQFRFSLIISQLLAKAIPVRGAKFRKSRLRKLKRDFCFYRFIQCLHVKKYLRCTFRFPSA
ncbi:hypothetical protein PEC301875_15680 [Pectobacterium carotovorum subsp. carotovorum]|nr:hypothetical protein PEC301875_15680 [Pectobacterium carotovorum subsp. carotovorum]